MPTPPLPPGFLDRPIAHRGLHDRAVGCIENSPAAFAAAVAAGYGIECDVQLSADGEAMVFHDATLDRLSGERGPVRARTAAELGRIGLTGSGDTIPTLGALLAQVGGRVPLVVEIKDQGGALDATGVGPLEARVAAVLAGYADPVAVMSFNPDSVAAMARLAPAVPRGIVAGGDYGALSAEKLAVLRAMTAAEATGSAFVSVHHRELPSDRSRALRAAGLAILCWTIRNPQDAQTVAPHADAITFEGFAA